MWFNAKNRKESDAGNCFHVYYNTETTSVTTVQMNNMNYLWIMFLFMSGIYNYYFVITWKKKTLRSSDSGSVDWCSF